MQYNLSVVTNLSTANVCGGRGSGVLRFLSSSSDILIVENLTCYIQTDQVRPEIGSEFSPISSTSLVRANTGPSFSPKTRAKDTLPPLLYLLKKSSENILFGIVMIFRPRIPNTQFNVAMFFRCRHDRRLREGPSFQFLQLKIDK